MNDLPSSNVVRNRLVRFLHSLPKEVSSQLEQLKEDGRANAHRGDFLWFHLVTSFATQGNSRGYHNLMANPDLLSEISYDNLRGKELSERQLVIEKVLLAAKVRMPKTKSQKLSNNLSRIEREYGGLEFANKAAFAQQGAAAKKTFLMQFEGIGEKYGRNIWMDIYDPDFHDSIAIDERVKKISTLLGIHEWDYLSQEQYYRDIAMESDVTVWDIDRTCYHFTDMVIEALTSSY
jgi:hypothetical protein